jgi:hypothetical protein
MSETIPCNFCDGEGKLTGMFPKYAEGHSGPPVVELTCHHCSGTGKRPLLALQWIARGEELKARRLFRGLGLREAADLWGKKPSELLAIENGLVDNLTWEPPDARRK